jgi:hypothetical protein
VTVRGSLEAELRALRVDIAGSALAAAALELASQLDDPGVAASAKAACARSLREVTDRLRELVPPVPKGDKVDEITARRKSRGRG